MNVQNAPKQNKEMSAFELKQMLFKAAKQIRRLS